MFYTIEMIGHTHVHLANQDELALLFATRRLYKRTIYRKRFWKVFYLRKLNFKKFRFLYMKKVMLRR